MIVLLSSSGTSSLLQLVVAHGLLKVVKPATDDCVVVESCPFGHVAAVTTGRPRGMTNKQFRALLQQNSVPVQPLPPLVNETAARRLCSISGPEITDTVSHGDVIVFVDNIQQSMLFCSDERLMRDDPSVDDFLFATPLEATDVIHHTLHKHEKNVVLPLHNNNDSMLHHTVSMTTSLLPSSSAPLAAILILRFLPNANNVLVVCKPSGLPTLPCGRNYFNSLTMLLEHTLMSLLLLEDKDSRGGGAVDVVPPASETLVVGFSPAMPGSERHALLKYLSELPSSTVSDMQYVSVDKSPPYDAQRRCCEEAAVAAGPWAPPVLRVHPLHRLDTGTSGVIALQLDTRGTAHTSNHYSTSNDKSSSVTIKNKRYVARVHGEVHEALRRDLSCVTPRATSSHNSDDKSSGWYQCALPMICTGPSRFGVTRPSPTPCSTSTNDKVPETTTAVDVRQPARTAAQQGSHRVTEWGSNSNGTKDAVSEFLPVVADDSGVDRLPLRREDHHELSSPVAPTVHSSSLSSFVGCVPVTGRTHQLRVHLAAIGCPIIGDSVYGVSEARQQDDDQCCTLSQVESKEGAAEGGYGNYDERSDCATEWRQPSLCDECSDAEVNFNDNGAENKKNREAAHRVDTELDSFLLSALSCEIHITTTSSTHSVAGETRDDVDVVFVQLSTHSAGLPAWCPESVAAAILHSQMELRSPIH
ncbi:pseudouridine synthase A-like protein, putative [Bodo saltans]|uniref:Pseudouridine synthase A-like protein, putative n=1 Tax=Bodo saltans TaxID=75058 RepID=A0A0S4JAU4_BODSA|nr:pseudouridine synthase A-like protein, putative [Bodo saltans]|eukprot:CUG87317.1 pseudouridine synthase A-like protein, putative [Bodo saltans]